MTSERAGLVGTRWRSKLGREVLIVKREWDYFAEPTVRGHPEHGGRPLICPITYLREHYEEVR